MAELIGPALFSLLPNFYFIYFLSGMERLNAGQKIRFSLSRLFASFSFFYVNKQMIKNAIRKGRGLMTLENKK
jgi:hypothetical protein